MYRRIKDSLYRSGTEDGEELEDIKIDKFESNVYDDTHDINVTFKNKIANKLFSFYFLFFIILTYNLYGNNDSKYIVASYQLFY